MALMLTEGAIIADRFRLERLLGQGAMGTVWLAQHTVLQTKCAVKFIHEEIARSDDARERFTREARAAAQLSSQYVVGILDSGVHEGVPYIAMEHLVGEELDARLKRLRVLSPAQSFRIVSQVGRALTKAHRAGIVHRDLKPANIFIARDDDEDEEIAKVLDFGIAKQTLGDASVTKTGALLGTPSYMSPEQAVGSTSVDHRTDLWALGVITFRLVTGQLPFRGDAVGQVLINVVTAAIPVPSQLAQVPPGFDEWWFRASQRDPSLRFQSAKELVDALRPILPGASSSWLDEESLAPAAAPPQPLTAPAATISHGPLPTVMGSPAPHGLVDPSATGGTVRGVASTHAPFAPAPSQKGGAGRWLAAGGLVVLVAAGAAAVVFMGGVESTSADPPRVTATKPNDTTERPAAAPPSSGPAEALASSTPSAQPSSSAHAPPPAPNARIAPKAQPVAPPPAPAEPNPVKPRRPAICDSDPYFYNSKGNLVPRPECM